MTSLPSGPASISNQFDDSPQVRGAVAFGRMVRETEERSAFEQIAAGLRDAIRMVETGDIGSAYRAQDRR